MPINNPTINVNEELYFPFGFNTGYETSDYLASCVVLDAAAEYTTFAFARCGGGK